MINWIYTLFFKLGLWILTHYFTMIRVEHDDTYVLSMLFAKEGSEHYEEPEND